MKTRSQIKGWLVAVLAAAVFAIAPIYYGLFATLNGPANKEKWFTPERKEAFDAWAERLLADGKPLELDRRDMSGPLEAFAVSNDISHVAVSPSEKRVKLLIFGRNRVGMSYELRNGNWSVVGVKDARAEEFLTTMRDRQRVYLRNLLAVATLLILVLVLPKRLFCGWRRGCLVGCGSVSSLCWCLLSWRSLSLDFWEICCACRFLCEAGNADLRFFRIEGVDDVV